MYQDPTQIDNEDRFGMVVLTKARSGDMIFPWSRHRPKKMAKI